MQCTFRVEHLGAMKKALPFLLGLVAFTGHAQVPAPAVRPDSAIHLNVVRNGRSSSAFYTVNQEPLTGASVKKLLRGYPPAAAELRKDRAQRLWGLALVPVLVAAFLVAKQQTDRNRYASGSLFDRAPVPVSIGLAAFIGYGYVELSNTHFAKAVEAYNRQFH